MISVKKRLTSSPPPLHLNKVIGNQSYCYINLSHYYKNTITKVVFIHYQVVKEIFDWVNKSLQNSPVAEVGGFLLGKFQKTDTGFFMITIERFCSAENVDYSSPNVLHFGTESLLELDKAKSDSPNLTLVGWFHTHPGHTPFLSKTDLQLHEGFFTHPYQVAIVLDSLTKEFDTGIFTRMKGGWMNNKNTCKDWISWKDLLVWSDLLLK